MSDQDRVSSYNIITVSTRHVMLMLFNVLIPLWIWNTLFSLTLRMTDKTTFQTNWVLNFQEFQAILASSKRLLQDVNLKRRTVETSWWQFHQIILSAYRYCTWFFTQFHVTVLCFKVSQWSTDHTFKNTFSCGEINECLISCWYYCQHDIQLNIHSVDMF